MAYKNIEDARQHARDYYWRNKKEIANSHKRYYKENRNKVLERVKLYYLENGDKKREYNRKWRESNKEKAHRQDTRRTCGSLERYNEATLKYEGECAFACGKQAEFVHHIDGKNVFNSPKNQVNNHLENLLPLCNSCHTWLHRPHLHRRNR